MINIAIAIRVVFTEREDGIPRNSGRKPDSRV